MEETEAALVPSALCADEERQLVAGRSTSVRLEASATRIEEGVDRLSDTIEQLHTTLSPPGARAGTTAPPPPLSPTAAAAYWKAEAMAPPMAPPPLMFTGPIESRSRPEPAPPRAACEPPPPARAPAGVRLFAACGEDAAPRIPAPALRPFPSRKPCTPPTRHMRAADTQSPMAERARAARAGNDPFAKARKSPPGAARPALEVHTYAQSYAWSDDDDGDDDDDDDAVGPANISAVEIARFGSGRRQPPPSAKPSAAVHVAHPRREEYCRTEVALERVITAPSAKAERYWPREAPRPGHVAARKRDVLGSASRAEIRRYIGALQRRGRPPALTPAEQRARFGGDTVTSENTVSAGVHERLRKVHDSAALDAEAAEA